MDYDPIPIPVPVEAPEEKQYEVVIPPVDENELVEIQL